MLRCAAIDVVRPHVVITARRRLRHANGTISAEDNRTSAALRLLETALTAAVS